MKFDEMMAEFDVREGRLMAEGRSNSWARAMVACAQTNVEMVVDLLPAIAEEAMAAGSATVADEARSVMAILHLALAQMTSMTENLVALEGSDWRRLERCVRGMCGSYRSIASKLRETERARDAERRSADVAEGVLSGIRVMPGLEPSECSAIHEGGAGGAPAPGGDITEG